MNLSKPFLSSITAIFIVSVLSTAIPSQTQNKYAWLKYYDPDQSICGRIPPPKGFERTPVVSGSFEDWLRRLPLKKGAPPVYLYNGKLKANQFAHYAVVDMDVGTSDLQQCADAVIRLRAEYLYSIGDYGAIHFKFTSGHNAEYAKWREGWRPVVGRGVRWSKSAKPDYSYENFKRYLISVFRYAGTYSLSGELKPVGDVSQMKIGDVFIFGGFPGHAVIVVDMAVNRANGEKLFLIAQSYMPAQETHVLNNPNDGELSPWYPLNFGETLYTPEWTFTANQLKRF